MLKHKGNSYDASIGNAVQFAHTCGSLAGRLYYHSHHYPPEGLQKTNFKAADWCSRFMQNIRQKTKLCQKPYKKLNSDQTYHFVLDLLLFIIHPHVLYQIANDGSQEPLNKNW